MRILVTRLRFLGDIVLSTPLLDTLRERFPDARIDYLASAPFAQVLEGHPSVDVLHTLPARPGVADLWRMVRELRDGPPIDWAIDLFSNPRSALLVLFSGARQRVGADRGIRARLYQHRRRAPGGDPSAIRHHLDRLVPLLGELPDERPPRLVPDPELASRLREELGLPGEFSLVHPGSTWPDKAWPVERWAPLVGQLREDGRAGEIAVVNPPSEEGVARRVADEAHARLLPPLSIGDLSALLPGATMYVGNDGGVVHMAVAHRVPTVALFGPTEPEIWFPYEKYGPYRVLHGCAPESFDANGEKLSRLGPISVAEVGRACREVLDHATAGGMR